MGVTEYGGIMRVGQTLLAFLARVWPALPHFAVRDGLLLASTLCAVTYLIQISCVNQQAGRRLFDAVTCPPFGAAVPVRGSYLSSFARPSPVFQKSLLVRNAPFPGGPLDQSQELPAQGIFSPLRRVDSEVWGNRPHQPDTFHYHDISLNDAGEITFIPALEQDQQGWLIVTAFAAPTTCVDLRLTTERIKQPQRHNLSLAKHFLAFKPLRQNQVPCMISSYSALGGMETQTNDGSSSPELEPLALVWPLAPSHPIHAEVRCRELFRGRRVQVMWDETDLHAGCEEAAHRLGTLVEQQLLPLVETWIGACDDRGGDSRITLAVSPRVHELAPTQDLKAFVRAADFHPSAEPAGSNRGNVVYLTPQVDAEQLPAILVHELAHVAQFCAFRRDYSQEPWPLADWLLEGHAHAVEVTLTGHQGNLLERIAAFLACPERSPLVIADTAATGLWRHPGTRGATAAFCVWLTETYGCSWWREIPLLALGETDWERQFGTPWRELYRQWTLALAIRGVSPAFGRPAGNEELTLMRPRAHLLGLDTQANITLVGTSSAYFHLNSEWADQGRIVLHTRPHTHLQVTFVRGPKEPSFQSSDH